MASGAAELFNLLDPDSIATSILNVCCDPAPQQALRRASNQRARELSWRACADVVWQAVEWARISHQRRVESKGLWN